MSPKARREMQSSRYTRENSIAKANFLVFSFHESRTERVDSARSWDRREVEAACLE